MTDDTRNLSTCALACIAAGSTTLGRETFSDCHEAISAVLGHSVWTHELAEKALWDRAAARVRESMPELAPYADRVIALRRTEDQAPFVALADEIEARFGKTVPWRTTPSERTESPLASLARIVPDKDVIVVTTGEGEER